MYPKANVPVVQLSIDGRLAGRDHVALGAALEPLRKEGVLVVASGNTVHNLGRLQWHAATSGEPWNLDFDAAATDLMQQRPGDIVELERHPSYRLAVPTPDHLLPLYYIAGIAHAANKGADVLVSGPTMGSLSMTSFVVAA
jgi:4,5-DOPA dioxygenase extradiol